MRDELGKLRSKVKGLEEGQMTVDNLQLSRLLDKEKDDLKKERANLLKDFAGRNDKLEKDKENLAATAKQKEAEMEKERAALKEKEKNMEDQKKDFEERSKEGLRRLKELDEREKGLNARLKVADEAARKTENEKKQLAEFAEELENLKNNLLEEREKLFQSKSRATNSKADVDQLQKELDFQKKDFEKEKERLQKDLAKQKNDLNLKEDRLEREKDLVAQRLAELEGHKGDLEKIKKEQGKKNEELEEANIAAWQERNKVALDIKGFLDDKAKMENDLKWKKRELEDLREEIKDEKKDLEEEKAELERLQQDIEDQKMDLEARERKLIQDREDFSELKRAFIEGIMRTGSYEQMTPEMKKMAKDLGVDIDELMEEAKRIKERKAQLEKLKKQNDDQLAKIKAAEQERNQRRNSNAGLRRQSTTKEKMEEENNLKQGIDLMKRIMVRDPANGGHLEYGRLEDFIKDLEDKRAEVVKQQEELDMGKQLLSQVQAENKRLQNYIDVEVADLIARFQQANADLERKSLRSNVATDTIDLLIQPPKKNETVVELGGEDYYEMKKRIRELEDQLRTAPKVQTVMVTPIEQKHLPTLPTVQVIRPDAGNDKDTQALDEELKK